MVNIGNDWDELLGPEFDKEYYRVLRRFLVSEYNPCNEYKVYPNMYDIFNALKYTSFADTKAVIIGQDPYHGPGQAHGLCFSVQKGVAIPPSLQNIYKELQSDLGIPPASHGYLKKWADNGVLMLNNVLTVRAGSPNSHNHRGWEILTDKVISLLNEREKPVVFILWGNNAKQKARLVKNPQHLILQSAHPSPLSAHNGFWGCRHFSRTNEFLIQNGMEPIDWVIE